MEIKKVVSFLGNQKDLDIKWLTENPSTHQSDTLIIS